MFTPCKMQIFKQMFFLFFSQGAIEQGRKGEMEIVQWSEPEQSDLTGSGTERKQMTLQAAETQQARQQVLESCAQLSPMKREADQNLSATTSCLRETRDRENCEYLRQNSDFLQSVPIQRKKKTSICQNCGKLYPSIFSKHKQSHIGERPAKCSCCGDFLSNSSRLSKHKQTHKGEKPHICSHCGNCFSDSFTLSRHKRTHTGEKPYKCPHCGECFNTSHVLSAHIRTHTGEKPYKCSHCGECFTTSSNLSRHKRTHTGEKPHKCSRCGKGFRSHPDLSRHEQTHTGEKPYKCPECGRCFNRNSHLKSHMKIHAKQKL